MQSQKQMTPDNMHITDSLRIAIVLKLFSNLSSEFHSFQFFKTKQKSNHQSIKENLIVHTAQGLQCLQKDCFTVQCWAVPTSSLQHATIMNLTFVMIHGIEKADEDTC